MVGWNLTDKIVYVRRIKDMLSTKLALEKEIVHIISVHAARVDFNKEAKRQV